MKVDELVNKWNRTMNVRKKKQIVKEIRNKLNKSNEKEEKEEVIGERMRQKE